MATGSPSVGEDQISVLHVDDDADFLDTAATFLTRHDDRLTIATATCTDDAIKYLAENTVDCVLSDYEMSDRNGVQFLKAVRDDHPDLPFILFTGKGSEEIASEAISAGATRYLTKRSDPRQYDRLATEITNAVTDYWTKQYADRFRVFVKQSTDIITVLDPDGTYRYQSPSVERILGYDSEEMVGENAFDYVHPDDREAVLETFKRAVSEPDVKPTVAYRFRHADGSWRWLESRGNNQLDNPTVEGFVVNSRDITERKQHERELRRTKDRMEFALETMDAIFWDWNVDEDAATFYPSETELYGTAVDNWEDFISLVHPEDRQMVREGIERALETGEPKEEEEVRIVQDGTVRWLEAPGKPLTDADGTTRMVGIARDVTEHRERARALKRRNERLDEFASIVSHDLQNPLNVAQLRLDQVARECDSDHVDDVDQALERMEQLIDNLLTLARQGETVGETRPVSLDDLSSHCWDNVETGAATIECETDTTLHADENRLREVLENLIRNAIEHGGDDVTITIGELDDGFYVEDDGLGIPEAKRDAVFEAGYSTDEDGTGFGLSIVKQVAEAHGWRIQVTDGTDGGARFEITGVEFTEC